jgi:hypothetical protein
MFLLVLILTNALAGCAGVGDGGSLYYLEPFKLGELSCEELRARLSATGERLKKSAELREKASRDPAGPLVNVLVYAPDYGKARWDHAAYEGEARRKNCGVEGKN